MKTNNLKLVTLIFSVFYTLTIFLSAESASIRSASNKSQRNPIVYRRYIRRRPPMQPNDQYVDEVIEIFHTKQKPPSNVHMMTDEDVDKFIFCDFNRELEECKKYWESRRPKKHSTTSTTTQKPREKTTKKPVPVENTTLKAQGTTTTAIPLLPNIPELVENTDLENYDEVDQNHLNNEVEMFNENEEEYDEDNLKHDVGANEEEKVEGNDDENVEDENGEDDYVEEDVNDNNDENNNIFL